MLLARKIGGAGFFAAWTALAMSMAACGGGNNSPAPQELPTATVQVNNSAMGAAANPLLLGNNIEWVRGGDGLLLPGTLQPGATLQSALVALAPTAIRYPGGALADVYQWQSGLGDITQRGMLPTDANGDFETVYFGTQEFLTLCAATGAKPLITLNVVTASQQDAADWVTLTNITRVLSDGGAPLPTVPYWEIGNEPYLVQNLANQPFTPDQYLAQANLFMPAIKSVDPTILTGVPLLGPTEALLYGASAYPQFTTVVLGGLTAAPDFFAVHDAYLPVGYSTDQSSLYFATVAGANQVNADLDELRAQVQQSFTAKTIPFAITEFNSLFTLNGSASDSYPQTLATAIYIADLFITFSNRTDMMSADYFQLFDGYVLGALSQSGNLRPGGVILTALAPVLKGSVLPVTVTSGAFNAPALGFFAGLQNVPLISAIATENQGTISLVLINKDFSNTQSVTVSLAGAVQSSAITEQVLYTGNVFQTFPEGGLNLTPARAPAFVNGSLTIPLQPHSIAILTISP
jgi:alpha-L-arabinofuranosidase